jgi:hypothetical protein
MWVRFGGDDRVKPQEYSEYFEDFAGRASSPRWPADGMRGRELFFRGP